MHQFDRDTLLVPDEAFSFCGQISDNWSINGVPDGGYLMAMLANAMMHYCQLRLTPIITANYLNRCEPGEARILIEKIAASKHFERFQANLHQSGKEKIRAQMSGSDYSYWTKRFVNTNGYDTPVPGCHFSPWTTAWQATLTPLSRVVSSGRTSRQ